MKTKMALLTTAILSLLCISCASNNIMSVNSTIQPATLDIGSLSRDQYVVIGQVSGEGIITAKTNLIKKQAKLLASQEPTYFDVEVTGDSGRYGFLGSAVNTNMTVLEKAVAIATYKMIQAAQYNGADTVVYVTTTTKILPKGYSSLSSESIVSAKVTGLAIKIKPDSGVNIKIPEPEVSVVKQLENEKEAEKEAEKAAKKAKSEAGSKKAKPAKAEAASSDEEVTTDTTNNAEATTPAADSDDGTTVDTAAANATEAATTDSTTTATAQ